MKKKYAISALIGTAIISCVILLLVKRQYFVKAELMNNLEVIWNDKEAFIKVGIQNSGVAGSLPRLIWRELLAFVSFKADLVREDMIVWHVEDGVTKRHHFTGFQSGGGMFPYGGNIYYTVGVDNLADWPALWRWKESSFEQLDKSNAKTIMATFSILDEVIAREGWHERKIYFTDNKVAVQMRLGTNNVVLVVEGKNLENSQMKVVRLLTDSTTQALIKTDSSYNWVDRKEYSELAK